MMKKALGIFVVVAVVGALAVLVLSAGEEEGSPTSPISADEIKIVEAPQPTPDKTPADEPTSAADQLVGSEVVVDAGDALIRADVVEAIERLEPLVSDCAERMRAKEKSLPEKISGRLVVRSVDGIGGVEVSSFEGDGPELQALLDCIGLANELITFPTVNKVNGQLEVDYTFTLVEK